MSSPVATITRLRHPLEGQPRGARAKCHHGQDELLLVLADGPKSLVPASWTDLGESRAEPGGAGAAILGTLSDLLAASGLATGLSTNALGTPEQAARRPPTKEANRATCTAQSAGGRGSAGSTTPLAQFPEADVAKALSLLAELIAKASEEGVSTDD